MQRNSGDLVARSRWALLVIDGYFDRLIRDRSRRYLCMSTVGSLLLGGEVVSDTLGTSRSLDERAELFSGFGGRGLRQKYPAVTGISHSCNPGDVPVEGDDLVVRCLERPHVVADVDVLVVTHNSNNSRHTRDTGSWEGNAVTGDRPDHLRILASGVGSATLFPIPHRIPFRLECHRAGLYRQPGVGAGQTEPRVHAGSDSWWDSHGV